MTAESPQALLDRARACTAEKRHSEAADLYRRLVGLLPERWEVHCNLGASLRASGRPAEAIEPLRRSIALGGGAEVLSNLGLALTETGQREEAGAAHAEAVRLNPRSALILCNAGAFHTQEDELDAAEDLLRRACACAPDFFQPPLKLGALLCRRNRHEEALPLLRRAVALAPRDPEAHSFLGLALLELGDLPEGFAEYEWRRGHIPMPRLPDPSREWQGGPLNGRTVLLYAEQGLGDVLQFARYATVAAAVGGRVILMVQPPLVRLLRGVPGVTQAVDISAPPPPHDCHLPLLSMARLVGTRMETIPGNVPYLRADPTEAARWRARLAPLPGLRVGLAWSGAPRPDDREARLMDQRRSLPLAALAPLAAVPSVSLISLQKGPAAAQAKTPPAGMALFDPMDEIGDFADTAALVEALDLVISVDTSVAHLAGGLKKPVWVLTRFDSEWRWRRRGQGCAWYPSARIFRQPQPGEWGPVIAEIVDHLREPAAEKQNIVVPKG